MSNSLKIKLKNITNGKKYIKNLLNKYKENDKINETDILSLLEFHPTKKLNIETIDYLILKVRKPFNQLALFYKCKNNDKLDDISYVICIQNIFGKYKQTNDYDIYTAFRNESHLGSKKQYFIDNTKIENNHFYGMCNNCNLKTTNITTDHHKISYKEIFTKFVELENIIISNVVVYENENNEIRITDTTLVDKWRMYHDNIAVYRLLCKSCNSHFGSYGYNPINN